MLKIDYSSAKREALCPQGNVWLKTRVAKPSMPRMRHNIVAGIALASPARSLVQRQVWILSELGGFMLFDFRDDSFCRVVVPQTGSAFRA